METATTTLIKGRSLPGRSLLLLLFFFNISVVSLYAQDIMNVQKGAVLTIQEGADMVVMGGISLDNGSSLTNNGTIRLKPNGLYGAANWTDNMTTGYNYGTGNLIFNSPSGHRVSSKNVFGRIEIDASGHVDLASDISTHKLFLVNGRVNTTSSYKVIVLDDTQLAVEADGSNPDFANSWVNGTLRRYLSPASVNNYTFPVGDAVKPNRVILDDLSSSPLNNLHYIDASFGPQPGNDIGLVAFENGKPYTHVNKEVWWLVPDVQPTTGNFDAVFYLDGFTGLTDNSFAVLKRPVYSFNTAEWISPAGSVLPGTNQPGRILSAGYARRNNISSFSQFGIGTFSDKGFKETGTDKLKAGVSLYPNPSNGQFTVQLNTLNRFYDAVITDMGGKVVRQLRLTGTSKIDISGLSAGTYLLRIPDLFGAGRTYEEKIIVIK